MMDICYRNESLSFKNIKEDDLTEVLSWYNNIQDYMFGTGVDKPITINDIKARFTEIVMGNHDFFAWILNSENERVGIIKGSVKSQENEVIWIQSLMIKTEFWRQGYGSSAVRMLIDFIRKYHNVSQVYVSVAEDNKDGLGFWHNIGFKDVKRMEQYLNLGGKQRDVVIMCRNIDLK